MELSTDLRAAMVNSFLCQYNEKWGTDWTIDIVKKYDRVDIFRADEYHRISCDGHFMRHLFAFCSDTFKTTPCVGAFQEQITFWI